jgi:hypothetical protein
MTDTSAPKAQRLCGLHWGYYRPGIFLWAIVLADGRIYIEREYVFAEMTAGDVADEILRYDVPISQIWGNPPRDIPENQFGEDVFETFYRRGLPVLRSEHESVTGWQRLQYWLRPMKIGDTRRPALIISPECETVVKTLPQLLQNKTNLEDCDDDGPIHAARALRYIVMSRPAMPLPPPKPSGRDLSKLDERTRFDIERMREVERSEQDRSKSVSFGNSEFWGVGS